MKIQFLGTAAAEGWPGIFCECEACQRAKALGGKNVRTRSSLSIDRDYKVDLPPDTYLHVLRYDLNLAEVRHLFITHSHYDHFHPDDLPMRRKPFAHLRKEDSLHIYGNEKVVNCIETMVQNYPSLNLRPHLMKPFSSLEAGELRVVPLLANHSRNETCLLFLFEVNGKTILHGYDSGWFPEETWDALKQHTLDLAILDCTNGKMPEMRYHMGVDGVLKTKEYMLSEGIADKDTVFIATHFSHNGGLLHEELVFRFQPHNVQVAFDGLEIPV